MFNNRNRKRVLGLNERYLEYIRPFNHKKAINIADDKVLTKEILKKHDIPVPEKLGVITSSRDLEDFDFDSLPKSFVMKPVHGVRGGGVEIFYNRDKDGNWIQSDGSRVSLNHLKAIARDLLDGKYSLFNEPDVVLIEERIRPHKAFQYYSYKGAPDIRVIVFNNIPVMSYVRLPTRESNGKANLDKGAIGAGIDMAVGKTTYAIIGKSQPIEKVPEYKLPISGVRIPYWNKILRYSIEASQASGLGFAAVDFLIDKEKGPLIVELNARPGLSIQLANHDGLRWRLKKAGGIKVKTAEKGVRLAKDLFGGEIEEGIEAMSGKDVIGLIENVTIQNAHDEVDSKTKNEGIKTKAKIDTGADSTSVDETLIRDLGYGHVIDYFNNLDITYGETRDERRAQEESLREELIPKLPGLADVQFIRSSHGLSLRPYIEIELTLGDVTYKTNASVYDRSDLTYKIIVGRKSLTRFLVDPSRKMFKY